MYNDSPTNLLTISGGGGGGGGRSDMSVFEENAAIFSFFSSAWKSSKVFLIFLPLDGLMSLCAGVVVVGFSTYFLSILSNVFVVLGEEELSREGICGVLLYFHSS